ncbi:response regulator [Pelagerythrobacter marinus]|uniref:response regulator n=1 Tax=Pelagerythrobacter marinus TaxID=538382 RepID=UPI00203751D9|nr:response regulator [Pelagerythrobacter marinus]USA39661.1 response regulator [Pelagerythrobacter marinus]WPZ06209.1 response regulator [Pelagerythrobacter marinus]
MGKTGRAPSSASQTPDIGHVLVVEDDAVLSLAIEAALRDAGARRVEICQTTEAALEALRRSRPDVVVLDVQLADRDDGWAIAELIDSVGPQPPRIVFSTGAPDRIPPQVAGLGTVLEKPYDPRDLVRAVAAPRRRGLLDRLRRPIA